MFTGLSTVATRRMPPRLGCPCAHAGRPVTPTPPIEASPAPAASPPTRDSHSRRVLRSQSAVRSRSAISRSSPISAVPPVVVRRDVLDTAVLHDEAHPAERLDVGQRVALDRDQIRAL